MLGLPGCGKPSLHKTGASDTWAWNSLGAPTIRKTPKIRLLLRPFHMKPGIQHPISIWMRLRPWIDAYQLRVNGKRVHWTKLLGLWNYSVSAFLRKVGAKQPPESMCRLSSTRRQLLRGRLCAAQPNSSQLSLQALLELQSVQLCCHHCAVSLSLVCPAWATVFLLACRLPSSG